MTLVILYEAAPSVPLKRVKICSLLLVSEFKIKGRKQRHSVGLETQSLAILRYKNR